MIRQTTAEDCRPSKKSSEMERKYQCPIATLTIKSPAHNSSIASLKPADSSMRVDITSTRTVIGRFPPGCDIAFEEEQTLSKQHLAIIVHSSGIVFVEDLGSSNGSYLMADPPIRLDPHVRFQWTKGTADCEMPVAIGTHGKLALWISKVTIPHEVQVEALPPTLAEGCCDDEDDEVPPPPALLNFERRKSGTDLSVAAATPKGNNDIDATMDYPAIDFTALPSPPAGSVAFLATPSSPPDHNVRAVTPTDAKHAAGSINTNNDCPTDDDESPPPPIHSIRQAKLSEALEETKASLAASATSKSEPVDIQPRELQYSGTLDVSQLSPLKVAAEAPNKVIAIETTVTGAAEVDEEADAEPKRVPKGNLLKEPFMRDEDVPAAPASVAVELPTSTRVPHQARPVAVPFPATMRGDSSSVAESAEDTSAKAMRVPKPPLARKAPSAEVDVADDNSVSAVTRAPDHQPSLSGQQEPLIADSAPVVKRQRPQPEADEGEVLSTKTSATLIGSPEGKQAKSARTEAATPSATRTPPVAAVAAASPAPASRAPVTVSPLPPVAAVPPVAIPPPAAPKAQWQFKVDLRKANNKDEAWSDYKAVDSAAIEVGFQAFKSAGKKPKKTLVELKLDSTYGIHFEDMVQFRFDDRSRQRPVRRKEL